MKKNILIAFLLFFVVMAQATIINVDNNANRPSGYVKNLQSAINNASSGDTIYVYPSNTEYAYVTISKKLHVFGFGYDGTTGANSKIHYINFDTTSTPSSNPSGSTIQGITFYGTISCLKPNINDIVLSGNSLSGISLSSNCSGWVISNNYIKDYLSLNNNVSIIISNNVFKGNSYAIYTSNSSSIVISNNLFMRWSYFSDVYNATISNNIFICNSNSYTGTYMSNNTFTNNISFCSNASQTYTLPPNGNTGTGNKQNQNPLFETGSTSSYYEYTKDYHLQSTSPGKNAGTDGTDIGPYGGTKPFVWGGAFSIPKITQMSISNPIINQGTDINVNVKAKKAEL